MGYVGWIGTFQGKKNDHRFLTEESELVRELRNLGAVLYCKTSVPATLMAGETVNNIIGYTWNPKNRLLSCGGSSGGEGALIALRGSPAGFGTDIGGSVRIPAGFNYLYGLRPSSGRMPYQGAANSMDGQSTILSVIGPLASTARSLTLLFKAVLSQQPWYHDPLVLELPWRDTVVEETRSWIEQAKAGKSTLAFGIMHWDGIARVHPPIARGLRIVEQTLKRLGHKVVPWNPPSHAIAGTLGVSHSSPFQTHTGSLTNPAQHQAFNMDGGADLKHHFSLSGESKAAQIIINDGESISVTELAALNVAKREYQKQYMDYWNSTAELTGTGRPVDGLFCPLAPHAAVIPNEYHYVGYTSFVNVLDYTSVAVPVTFADKNVDVRSVDTSTPESAEHIDWKCKLLFVIAC
jgi:amidase